MIHKSFSVDVATQFTASRHIFHRSPAAKWFYAFFVGLPLVYLVVAYDQGFTISDDFLPNLPIWLFMLATFGYAFIVMPLIQYYHVSKQFNQNMSAQKLQHYDITAVGFRNYGEGFNVDIVWNNVRAVEKTTQFLLFYITKNTAYFIPINLLTEIEINTIKGWFDAR